MYIDNETRLSENVSALDINDSLPDALDPAVIFGPERDSMYIVLPVTIIYVAIFVIGLLGNICTCLVIIRNKSMHTATNYYLFSLAVSDLLLLVSGLPQEMYSIWSKWPYVFGAVFCLIRGLAAETSANASVLTITLFTVERYLAICHPFQSHKMSKLSRATKHVVLLWIVALALALPQALQFGLKSTFSVTMCLQTRVIIPHSFEISTFVFFLAPMVVISVLYLLIGLRLSKTSRENNHSGNEQQGSEIQLRKSCKINKRHSRSTRRVVKMLVAVVVAFFICWAPFHAQRLVAIYGTRDNHLAKSPTLLFIYSIVTYISGVFYYMSTCVNPVLYHIMSHKFREAFKNTLLWCCFGFTTRPPLRCVPFAVSFSRVPTSSGTDHSGNCSRSDENSNKKEKTHQDEKQAVSKRFYRINRSTNSGDKECSSHFCRHKWTKQVKLNNKFILPTAKDNLLDITSDKIIPQHNNHDEKPNDRIRGSIESDSSLKTNNKQDLEDELTSYINEIKIRVSLQEKEYL